MSKAGSNAHARTIREDKKRFIFETCVAFGDLVFLITSVACAAVCPASIITREGSRFRISRGPSLLSSLASIRARSGFAA
jgi:hypothetical protein